MKGIGNKRLKETVIDLLDSDEEEEEEVVKVIVRKHNKKDELCSMLGRPDNPYRGKIYPKRKLVLGFDPGYVCPGFAWLDPVNGEVLLQIRDMTIEDGVKYKFERERLAEMMEILFSEIDHLLQKTSYAFIEDQIVPSGPRPVLEICAMFEIMLRARYPHIETYRVRPQRVRAYFGIGQNKRYKDGKKKSEYAFQDMVSEEDFENTRAMHTKKEFHVDAMEAALIAQYGFENYRIVKGYARPPKVPKYKKKVEPKCLQYVSTLIKGRWNAPGDCAEQQDKQYNHSLEVKVVKRKTATAKATKPKKKTKKSKKT